MTGDLLVPVGDLIGSPGTDRPFAGEHTVRLRLGETLVEGPIQVEGTATGSIDAVITHFRVDAEARFSCIRCLVEWVGPVSVEADQVFRRAPDEDGYGIVEDTIDMTGPATDELALALPAGPLCRPDCKGLCPTCGTDLNTDPCDGHGEESESPFAALKDLFDP